ncbi:vacuolar protein sorting-associated protein 37B [Ischnura elegans]|uniref:vacuolar protein sorting-associated protein 37B n=1 Tax=Ischnura elegans TaxID=197161 RepID=UPI001ED8AB93|nr:vacuolar protein sorting-associated protein 37B [Ischnura elegans]
MFGKVNVLARLSDEELKELLNDDSKCDELVENMQEIKNLVTEKEMLMASNKSLAEYNLSKEPSLTEGKQRLLELSETASDLYTSVEAKLAELKKHSGNLSSDTTLALLQTAAAETEEESETLANKFLDGDIEVDAFLDQFAVLRKLMHLRRVKADKMAEILTKMHQDQQKGLDSSPFLPPTLSPSINNSHPTVPTTGTPFMPHQSGATPYPLGPISMPMPGSFGY